MWVSLADHPAIVHNVTGTGVYIVKNMTGVGDNQPAMRPFAYRVDFLQQAVYQLTDKGYILKVNPGFGLIKLT